ncbi:MAG: tetratricopeptide repeat protein [Muribaculaceae bacterium]|nr:tetratricopeptide repeat protein [Muribaculaceae bacterium]
MKKTLILLAAGLVGFSANAQSDVLKEAERAMKGDKGYTEVLAIVTPAFTNPETANNAQTYYIPGKAGFKQYDNLLGKQQLGMLKDGESLIMANALLGGYDNFIKALPLDTVVDAKGKTKTKYSKDIVSTVAGHYNDFASAAAEFFNAKEFDKAYKGWDIFCKLSIDADRFGIKAHPDTLVANYMFNRSLAAWQNDDFPGAVQSFREAIQYGYNKPEVFEYGIVAAQNAKDNEAVLEFATEGNKRFGASDPQYINQIINYYLQTSKYDEAITYLDAAIADNPNNAQYYALKGIIMDNKGDLDAASELYRKALGLDSDNGLANQYLGRAIGLKAGQLSDAYDGDPTKFADYNTSTLFPMYKEAVGYLEKAYEVDKANRKSILETLNVLYYQLGDDEGMESVKMRKLDD